MLKAIIKFISESRTELAKVTWPTRQVAINLTLTVIGVTVIFALYIAGADYVLTEGVKLITRTATTQSQPQTPTEPTPQVNIGDITTQPVN